MPDIDTSKLEAINTMLALIGEAPVNSLTEGLTEDVQIALRTLDQVGRAVQGVGWHWNTDNGIKIQADGAGKFPWQTDWIRFDTVQGKYTDLDLVRRGEFLYDRENSTFTPPHTELEGEAVKYLDWDDLPEAARNYIMIRAARIFLNMTVGDRDRSGYAAEDERAAWRQLNEEEADQSDASLFDTDLNRKIRRPGGGGLLPGLA